VYDDDFNRHQTNSRVNQNQHFLWRACTLCVPEIFKKVPNIAIVIYKNNCAYQQQITVYSAKRILENHQQI